MKKIFIIDGGAGRVISAIPALEHYVSNSPDDVKIMVYGWDSLFWGNKLLQPLVYNINDKDTFKNHFYTADVVIHPEPYNLPEYYTQKVNLIQAFDIIINGKNNYLNPTKFNILKTDALYAKGILSQYTHKHTIVIQPFGSSASLSTIKDSTEVVDPSNRSMDLLMYSKIVKYFSEKYNIVLFADPNLHFAEDIYTYKFNIDILSYVALMSQADYFIGCDSSGQHIARSLCKPGSIVFGSTFPENVSYPEWFNILDKNNHKVYSPIRINDNDCKLADRLNSECMKYSEQEIDEMCKNIELHIQESIGK